MNNLDLNTLLDEQTKEELNIKLTSQNVSIEKYIAKVIKKDLDSYINFKNGYYFDRNIRRLFDSQENQVPFTKLENDLFNLLLLKRGDIVTYDEIEKFVWKDLQMSRFTLRNKIRDIRTKTYKGIVKTSSNLGYKID